MSVDRVDKAVLSSPIMDVNLNQAMLGLTFKDLPISKWDTDMMPSLLTHYLLGGTWHSPVSVVAMSGMPKIVPTSNVLLVTNYQSH